MNPKYCNCPLYPKVHMSARPTVSRPTRPFAIFFNNSLQGQSDGRTSQEAAANWLNYKERCNPGYFDTNEIEITVGHYANSRIQRLSVHKFRRSAWVAVVEPIDNEDEE